uniref:Pectinesterase n=1 Tax=Fagus sylvatica TaxID=28930 RepID=A0A2N9IJ67_FAGSY
MSCATTLLLLLAMATTISCLQELEMVQRAHSQVLQARNWVQAFVALHGYDWNHVGMSLSDCAKLYNESESRLARLLSDENYTHDDAHTWLSGVLANHRSCVDGLGEKGFVEAHEVGKNLTSLLSEALALYGKSMGKGKGKPVGQKIDQNGGNLISWNPATSKANFIVAKDGSGTHTTINDAVAALSRMGHDGSQRIIIYVKSGVYNENVEIERNMKNVMFVGDGMDKTIVTGNRNVPDGSTTFNSATFGVWGDGFWARDITFENTAGPQKQQAVALRVGSDCAVFYRCSFKGYQDTLCVHSLRQFYRDCHIYGTIDFIFGDAPVVFQNCDIFVRRPMDHQANIITAQDLDGIIDPKGWTEYRGAFALSTLFYGEYMNVGASIERRVNWPGFHVLTSPREASAFTASSFIQGESWIPMTGVPLGLGI